MEIQETIQSQPIPPTTDQQIKVPISDVQLQATKAYEKTIDEDDEDQDRYIYMTKTELQRFKEEYPELAVAAMPGRPKLISDQQGRPSKAYRYRIGCIMSIREVNEALSGPESEHWKAAMDEEIKSLEEKGTYYLIKRPPKTKVVKNRWILTKKEDGRYKARLVAKGFTQKFGVDYQETFSPVIRCTSIRLLLSHANASGMLIHHVDVKNAYLNSPLQETIYMEQPYLFERGNDRVCLLEKSIYGLKQAAKCWHDHLVEILSTLGLQKLKTEPCIATNKDRNLIVGFYVDDLIILSHNIEIIETFKSNFG